MPYIRKELKYFLDPMVNDIIKFLDEMRNGTGRFDLTGGQIKDDKDMAGILTFITFKLIRHYYETGKWYDKMDAIKVCESAMDEFKRRFLHPYEDDAIKRNGDVL